MTAQPPFLIKTISEYHRFMALPQPSHPLVSVTKFEDIKPTCSGPFTRMMDFYSIAIKRNFNVKMKYGQKPYDFDEGIMFCMSPGQVLSVENTHSQESQPTGWHLLFHPDLLWNTSLSKNIRKYAYFDYAVNEALFLSAKEEELLIDILQRIDQECKANTDQFSQDVIIAQLELLLTYTERFYHRQFITRKINNHQVLDRLEQLLIDYFNNNDLTKEGLPTVTYVAEKLNISPNYLSGLVKVLTGHSTQYHIHEKLIEKAKLRLSTSSLSIGEIAYELGFEHPQSFSKLFKTKTKLSPIQFRQAFN